MDEDMDELMDLDPSLSLNAAGLWSDEESLYNPQSESDDPEAASAAVTLPKKRVALHTSIQQLTSRDAAANMKYPHLLKSRRFSITQLPSTPPVTSQDPKR